MNIITKKKILIIFGAIAITSLILIGITTPASTPPKSNSYNSTQETRTNLENEERFKENWKEVLFDIGEWNKNDGETITERFTIKSEKWRIKWAKRKTTQVLIEVFTSDGKSYGEPFTAEFNETEGILDFKGRGTYYIHMIGGTNPSASVWDITVEELE